MSTELVLYDLASGVAAITLNHPATKNSLLFPLLADLQSALQRANDDPAVRCVVLQGANGSFSSGGNVKSMQDPSMRIVNGEAIEGEGIIRLFSDSVWAIRKCLKPVVARLEGNVAGAAISLALACDFRYVKEGTRFICAFSKVGLVADSGILSLLKNLAGYQAATELAMQANILSAENAYRLGLVNKVLSETEFDGFVQSAAFALAQGPTLAYSASKQCLNALLEEDFRRCVSREAQLIPQLRASADHAEGVRAFAEKRPAQFTGK